MFYLIGFGSFFGSLYLLGFLGLNYDIANTVSMAIFFLINFLLQRYLTFKSTKSILLSFLLILLFYTIKTMDIWTDYPQLFFTEFFFFLGIRPYGSMISVALYFIILFILEYFYTRYLVYRQKPMKQLVEIVDANYEN